MTWFLDYSDPEKNRGGIVSIIFLFLLNNITIFVRSSTLPSYKRLRTDASKNKHTHSITKKSSFERNSIEPLRLPNQTP